MPVGLPCTLPLHRHLLSLRPRPPFLFNHDKTAFNHVTQLQGRRWRRGPPEQRVLVFIPQSTAWLQPPALKPLTWLQSIASFNGDLSSMTAPPFILGTTSLTEFSAYWTEHPSIFVAPASEPDPTKRSMLVLKWFLSTLKQQYSSRSDKYGTEKKPFNPFLGELYLGKWEDPAGETRLVSEQVKYARSWTPSEGANDG